MNSILSYPFIIDFEIIQNILTDYNLSITYISSDQRLDEWIIFNDITIIILKMKR